MAGSAIDPRMTFDSFVPGDANGREDVFLYDRQTGSLSPVSSAPGTPVPVGRSSAVCLSPDARYVAFSTLSRALSGAEGLQVVRLDRRTGALTTVSRSSTGEYGNGYSSLCRVGDDGTVTLFNKFGNVHLVVDLLGWVPAGVPYAGLTPARLVDTRTGNTTIDVLINALEEQGLVRTLAEPNLTALSGDTASFIAGGEIPVPIVQPSGGTTPLITVEYKPFGVSLSYTPVVLANGRISLRVAPSVSEISSVSVVGGTQTAALSKRSAETTVELGSGQSFMIAGLIQNSSVNSIDKAPGIGDVPVLGNLFRSTAFRRNETELVIVVTPYLVRPMEEKDVHLPTDGFQVPGEVERLFGNQVHGKDGGARPMPTATGTAGAAPRVGAADAQPGQPRREEKVAAAAPGFSFK